MSTTGQPANSTANRNGAKSNTPIPAVKKEKVITTRMVDMYGVAAFIAIGALAYGLGFRPLIQRHQHATSEKQLISTTRDRLNKQQVSVSTFRDQLTSLRQQYQSSPVTLESTRKLNEKLSILSDVAAKNAIVLDDLQPDKSSAGSQFDSLPIHLSGSAAMPAFIRLLHQLHQDQPDLGLVSFDLAGNPREAVPAKFSAQLIWYTQPSRKSGIALSPEQAASTSTANRSVP